MLGVLIALPLTAAVGYAAEVTIARSLYTRDHLDHVLATFGLILIADTTVHFFWGAEGMGIPTPEWAQGRVTFAGAEIPAFRLVIVGTGLAVAAGLWLMVTRTRLGMLIRAGASNRTMVQALGVDIQRLFAIVFALGAAMAGLAGLMIAPITEASIGMGNEIIIVAFVVIIIGGIGSVKGALIGALIVGVIDTMGRSYLDVLLLVVMSPDHAETAAPALSAMLIYILMAAILVIRPEGLFPPRTR